ncbi:MAG TPA: hypothetical protein VFQ39_14625 [Longimicrobium sp.]|nr:hypothetical protein [Longimicrobium sp.]
MRRHALLVLSALALAAPARAQDTIPWRVEEAALPARVARRVTDFFNAPGTIHFTGDTRIPAARTVQGDVAVLGGALEVAGRVEGDVVVINGGVRLAPGAEITGDLTVVGGSVTGAEDATVGGELAVHAGRLRYRRNGDRIALGGPEPSVAGEPAPYGDQDQRDDGWTDATEGGWVVEGRQGSRGRADFIVATGQSYNRVEGLPVTFGPVFETEGSNPFRLRVMGIYRTEQGDELDPGRWGFEARAEQFLGGHRAFRVGGAVYRRIDPIEDWHVTKLENGLSTFFLHRDFRDHYEREGGSVYALLTPVDRSVSARLEFRSERQRPKAAGSPWTLFDNDDPWRPQPLAARGLLNSIALGGRIDTRNDENDPASGWLVEGEVEQALGTDLSQPATRWMNGPEAAPVPTGVPVAAREYDAFTHGMIDIRRYNRIGPASRLNLRLLAGGSLDGSPLPPQRQHALGGEGSLPGYALFSVDCGARSRRVINDVGPERNASQPEFFPAYGCDRFVLGQVEYRGDLSFRVDLGTRRHYGDDDEGSDGEGEDEDGFRGDLRADFGWVLFADVGRGWTTSRALGDEFTGEETAVDVGAGVLLGPVGAYLAIPVANGGNGVNFFIRLNPRF